MKLKLFKPLHSQLVISQNFGENNVCIKTDGTGNVIGRTGPTCPIGYESIYKQLGMYGHNALDIPAKDWQPVFSACEGIVTELQTERERGLGIGITSQQKYDVTDTTTNKEANCKIKLRYWHLAGMNVKIGQIIKVGDLIGWADNTGFSTGTHVHFELKATNDDGTNIWQGNGFFGAIDPFVYLQDISAMEQTDIFAKIQIMIWDIADQVNFLIGKMRK